MTDSDKLKTAGEPITEAEAESAAGGAFEGWDAPKWLCPRNRKRVNNFHCTGCLWRPDCRTYKEQNGLPLDDWPYSHS